MLESESPLYCHPNLDGLESESSTIRYVALHRLSLTNTPKGMVVSFGIGTDLIMMLIAEGDKACSVVLCPITAILIQNGRYSIKLPF